MILGADGRTTRGNTLVETPRWLVEEALGVFEKTHYPFLCLYDADGRVVVRESRHEVQWHHEVVLGPATVDERGA